MKNYNTGYQRVKKMITAGELKTLGGKIIIEDLDLISRKEYEKLEQENLKLKEKLNMIEKIAGGRND